ncbi:MAG: two-component sensor histidine kinase [Hyphomicrobiaceae bacterium]|nr:two-component sensor histidine kinase [Hyphomicrobiaceae bacterium]MCC0025313.1 two-component sensor histidine kinase [Hyphomicrobiaceae bacterium]
MRSLRYRFALILIASMSAVVLVATIATWLVSSASDANRMIEPVASQIEFAVQGINSSGELPSMPPFTHTRLSDQPEAGEADNALTSAMQRALSERDLSGSVQITKVAGQKDEAVSYQYAPGSWVVMEYPGPPPPPPHMVLALGLWLVLMIAGVASVALILARRVTEPFAILEKAVADVGEDGTLPHIPEDSGSGEARHTATVLNRLSDRLRTAMASRMRLVAAAGHDLRTPITRMRLRAEFLPEEEQSAWIDDIDELEMIADSAIRLVKEGGSTEEPEEMALDQVVREVAHDLEGAGLPVKTAKTDNAIVKVGPLSLRRALGNLVTNAATHGGGAEISLAARGDKAVITIEDNGPGIPEEMMSHVFEPFFRAAPGRTRTIKGSGLGLAIAKEIIERAGGALTIENRPQGGLRQTISFNRVSK